MPQVQDAFEFDPFSSAPALGPGDPSAQPMDQSADYGYATYMDQAPPGATMAPQADYSKVAPVPANMLGMKLEQATVKVTPILSGGLLGVLGYLLGRKGKAKVGLVKILVAAGAGIATQKALAQIDGRAPGVRYAAAAGAGWLAGRSVR